MNTDAEVLASYDLPADRSVKVIDSTLRKLDYTAGVRLSTAQRVELVLAAEAVGAHETYINNLHFEPSYIPAAREILARRTQIQLSIQTFLTTRWREGLDAAISVEPDYCEVEARSSPQELMRDGSDQKAMATRVVSALDYGTAHGAVMTAGFMDCTRADFGYLIELINLSIEGGAAKVVLYDSFGCLTPDAFRVFVHRIRNRMISDVPVAVHVHDAFGLATACTVAAVTAGATMVDCATYGLPTHLRLAPLEETVLSLELLYGVRTGMKLGRLTEYARQVEAVSGVPRAVYQPITGEHRFVTDSEVGLSEYLRGAEPLARPYFPHVLGRDATPVWTIGSLGPDSVRAKLATMGIKETAALVSTVEDEVRKRLEELAYPAWLEDDDVTQICRAASSNVS